MADLITRIPAEQIVDAMVDPVIVIDGSAAIVDANRAAAQLLAAPRGELLGRGLAEVLGETEHFGRGGPCCGADGKAVRDFEFVVENRAGRKVPVSFTASPIRGRGGALVGHVAVLRDLTEVKLAKEGLDYVAHHDVLTGLPNRLLFGDRLEQALARARRYHDSVAVMLMDLDKFKEVNDTLGHETGDLLLKAVARKLEGAVRQSDTVGRMGGDEFTFILPDLKDPKDAATVAARVVESIAEPVAVEAGRLYVSASVGISVFPLDGQDAEGCMKNADIAMYKAKGAGGNTFRFFAATLSAAHDERRALEKDLQRAIGNEEFTLFYQPEVSLSTGGIVGAEGLIRWRHPSSGLIPAGKFIPIAEETGLIVDIGEVVLRAACRQAAAWRREGFGGLRVSVNLSLRQFRDKGLVDMVGRVLAETGADPAALEIEVTETTVMRDLARSALTLRRLGELGVRIALDDFGVTFSSLTHLGAIPVDTLKIDQAFVRNVSGNMKSSSLISAIVSMARLTQIDTIVAEGVETEHQLQFYKSVGCDAVQGYLLSKVVPPDDFSLLLRKEKPLDFKVVNS